jgi:hypothetical protein
VSATVGVCTMFSMRTKSRFASVSTVLGVTGALLLVSAPTAQADIVTATPSPATWAAGSSQDFTLTLEASGTLDGSLGFYSNNSGGWFYTVDGTFGGTLVGDTVTCDTGITYQSSAFTAWTPGYYPYACETHSDADSFDSWLETAEFGGVTLVGTQTVTVHIPAGIFVASTVPGTYTFRAYGYNGTDVRVDFDMFVGAAPQGEPASYLQQVGLPASGTCDAIDDASLAWGTSLTGGWAKAWGEWANDGKGTWVCSRTITWSPKHGAWVVE